MQAEKAMRALLKNTDRDKLNMIDIQQRQDLGMRRYQRGTREVGGKLSNPKKLVEVE